MNYHCYRSIKQLPVKGIWNKLFLPPLNTASRYEEALLADIPKQAASSVGAAIRPSGVFSRISSRQSS